MSRGGESVTQSQQRALRRVIMIGFSLNVLISVLITEIWSLSSTLLSALGLCLGVIYLHDETRLAQRQTSGRRFPLDQMGIDQLNDAMGLETVIVHEDDHSEVWCVYSSSIEPDVLERLRESYKHYQSTVEANLEGVPRRAEQFLDVRALPDLPSLNERHQVGLFAAQDIPAWSLFYWSGDLGVAHQSDHHLSETVQMNRRTLVTLNGVDFFQGGSERQRSMSGVLANFYWCDSQSTHAAQCDYRVLPPHFLGEPNCVYVTTRRGQVVCSGLLAFKEIKANDQLLMFTGSDEQSRAIERRLNFYRMLPYLALVGFSIPVLQLLYIITAYFK